MENITLSVSPKSLLFIYTHLCTLDHNDSSNIHIYSNLHSQNGGIGYGCYTMFFNNDNNNTMTYFVNDFSTALCNSSLSFGNQELTFRLEISLCNCCVCTENGYKSVDKNFYKIEISTNVHNWTFFACDIIPIIKTMITIMKDQQVYFSENLWSVENLYNIWYKQSSLRRYCIYILKDSIACENDQSMCRKIDKIPVHIQNDIYYDYL